MYSERLIHKIWTNDGAIVLLTTLQHNPSGDLKPKKSEVLSQTISLSSPMTSCLVTQLCYSIKATNYQSIFTTNQKFEASNF